MRCSDCYWCTQNSADDENFVCCNQESENYNENPFAEEIEIYENVYDGNANGIFTD